MTHKIIEMDKPPLPQTTSPGFAQETIEITSNYYERYPPKIHKHTRKHPHTNARKILKTKRLKFISTNDTHEHVLPGRKNYLKGRFPLT